MGRSWWNERSYSSASTTYRLSPPRRRLPPQAGTRAPTKPVGSSPAAASTAVVSVVVVVLPCVPAMPTTVPWFTMAPSACARLSTGNAGLARGHQLRVVGGDGGRHHQGRTARHVAGVVPLPHDGATRFQMLRGRSGGRVAPRDPHAREQRHLGERRHPRAANPHEVHGAAPGQLQQVEVGAQCNAAHTGMKVPHGASLRPARATLLRQTFGVVVPSSAPSRAGCQPTSSPTRSIS